MITKPSSYRVCVVISAHNKEVTVGDIVKGIMKVAYCRNFVYDAKLLDSVDTLQKSGHGKYLGIG